MGDFLGDEEREEIAIRPRVLLGAAREVAPRASRIGEVQPFQHRVELRIAEGHE